MTKQPPAGLKRYAEWLPLGKRTGRVAYVLDEWNLPEPVRGGEWALDAKFDPSQEILRDPTVVDIFVAAAVDGLKVVVED